MKKLFLVDDILESYSDLELVSKYSETKKEKYINSLYNRYVHLIYGMSFKYLKDSDSAYEMTNHVFLIILEKIVESEVKNFANWIYSIVKNECFRYISNRRKFVELDEKIKKSDIFMEFGVLDTLLDDNTKVELLRKGVETLKPDQRNCIEMFYFRGYSYKDIIEETDYTDKEVKSYIQNGKRKLKIFIEKSYENNKI